MIKHMILYKFKDFAEGADKQTNTARAKEQLESLVGRVPTLLAMRAGANVVEGANAWDFALVAEFTDAEALQAYMVHPEHKKVAEFISKVRLDRASVDFEF